MGHGSLQGFRVLLAKFAVLKHLFAKNRVIYAFLSFVFVYGQFYWLTQQENVRMIFLACKTEFHQFSDLSHGREVRVRLALPNKVDHERDEGKSFRMCTSRTLHLANI